MDNYPLAFKVYKGIESISFPTNVPFPTLGALEAIHTNPAPLDTESIPDIGILGQILFLSAGITKEKKYPGGKMYYRAAACTGALYHIDLYVVCGKIKGLDAGVYHFSPHDFSLRKLREGDHRGILVKGSAEEPSLSHAPVILATASTYWRNSWKYRSRTYRHCGWDNGTLLANLLAATAGYSIPTKIICGFLDNDVNRLFDLETRTEAVLSLISIGWQGNPLPTSTLPKTESLGFETLPISKNRIDYPAITDIHSVSCLKELAEVIQWRDKNHHMPQPTPTEKTFPLKPSLKLTDTKNLISDVIIRRGSTRRFAQKPLTFEQLSNALEQSLTVFPTDYLESTGNLLNDAYLIVHSVKEIPAGTYVYHRTLKTLELLKEGNFRSHASYLGLGQALPGDAAVNIYLMLDLAPVLETFGNRGYRVAQLEAGILGGKLYLSSYAQNFGATGLTFLDNDVTDFFSPHASGKSVMFLMALGHKFTHHQK